MNTVGKIDYTLKDYAGVSAKSGNPAETAIVYSTQHIEKSARESLYKLDYETRGVLFHELVHAYQFEPKGIGSYSTNREFWACIEGLADAVRAEAGLFDIAALRKPGGHWLDGYKTTGFFLQWLTTMNPDALREFHVTVREWMSGVSTRPCVRCSAPKKASSRCGQSTNSFCRARRRRPDTRMARYSKTRLHGPRFIWYDA